jgi:signal transduction histidine kinase
LDADPSAGLRSDEEARLLWQRFLATGERDLQRLVLDIHDGPVQYLFAAISQLKAAASKLEPDSPGAVSVIRGLRLLEHALGEIRDVVGAFRPPGFERRPPGDIIEGLVVQHEAMTGQVVDLELDPDLGDCSLPTKIGLYRIVQEALANGYRHAAADSQRVVLSRRDVTLHLTVADDGRGFDVESVLRAEEDVAVEGGHFGLRGIQDRVNVLGGAFSVHSTPGRGTELHVALPCHP